MAISIIKLSSGETVLADVLGYDEETYNLEILNPLQLKMSEDLSVGKMNMFTSMWIPLFGEETTIDIRSEHIIAMQQAPNEMINYYLDSMKELQTRTEITDDVRAKVMREILKVANTSIH
jgi:hypothetical protein